MEELHEIMIPSKSNKMIKLLTQEEKSNLLHLYDQLCETYHAIDNFRMKLLSFLPLFSVVGILFIEGKISRGEELIGFSGLFACLFTIALFVYEIRGIVRCNTLIQKGRVMENALELKGQFYYCKEEQQNNSTISTSLQRLFNTRAAASLIYSLVAAAWFYIFLIYSSNLEKWVCILSAAGGGFLIAVFVYFLVVKDLLSA